jgi:hypothetical protein
MKDKTKYKIVNWSEYNRSLINRGSLTFWFSKDSLKKWKSTKHTNAKGRPEIYSDDAILCALILRQVFNLPLRGLQGFIASVFNMLNLDLPVPGYTQICRRSKTLGHMLKKLSNKKITDIVFDSSGLKVYGEGEWKVRTHGKGKRRTWRKIHMGLCPHTQEIMLCELTHNNKSDAQVAEKLLDQVIETIDRVYGDGAYDDRQFREKVYLKGGRCLIPPPRNATYKGTVEGWERQRDANIAEIIGLGGDELARKLWKKLSGYHQRSLVETAFSRIKRILGPNLKAHLFENQMIEAQIKCLIINKMTSLGMPQSEPIFEMAA